MRCRLHSGETRLYVSWQAVRLTCENPTSPSKGPMCVSASCTHLTEAS